MPCKQSKAKLLILACTPARPLPIYPPDTYLDLHALLETARDHAHKGNFVPVPRIHVGLQLKYEAREVGAGRGHGHASAADYGACGARHTQLAEPAIGSCKGALDILPCAAHV